MRILYVEDNPANVYLVKRVARAGQHEVINYVDGGRVLRDFGQINPDLVLMDIQLVGEMSGIDVVKKLRSEGHSVPIIAVTAYAMMGDRDRCLEAGCDDYMAKPLPIPQLMEMFSKYGATSSPEASTPTPSAAATDTSTASPEESKLVDTKPMTMPGTDKKAPYATASTAPNEATASTASSEETAKETPTDGASSETDESANTDG